MWTLMMRAQNIKLRIMQKKLSLSLVISRLWIMHTCQVESTLNRTQDTRRIITTRTHLSPNQEEEILTTEKDRSPAKGIKIKNVKILTPQRKVMRPATMMENWARAALTRTHNSKGSKIEIEISNIRMLATLAVRSQTPKMMASKPETSQVALTFLVHLAPQLKEELTMTRMVN